MATKKLAVTNTIDFSVVEPIEKDEFFAGQSIPRTLEEDFNYDPAWRSLTVAEYLKKAKDDKGEIVAASVPEEEKDSDILYFFAWRLYGACPDIKREASYCWAYRLHRMNKEKSGASRLKAFFLAKLSIYEIAERMGTSPLNVATYLRLYFDIERYMDNKDFINRVVFIPGKGSSIAPEAVRERFWMTTALLLGWKGLQQVLYKNVSLSEAEVEQMTKVIKNCLAQGAYNFALSLTSEPEPLPNHLEKYNDMVSTQAVLQQFSRGDETSKATTAAQWITGILKDKAVKNPENKPLQLFARVAKTIEVEAEVVPMGNYFKDKQTHVTELRFESSSIDHADIISFED